MKKSLSFWVASVLIICLVLIAAAQFARTRKKTDLEELLRTRVAIQKATIKKYVPKILELQKIVNQSSDIFLISTRSNKDAGPYFNAIVGWVDVVNDLAAKAAYEKYTATLGPAKVAELSLPLQATEKLNSLGPDCYKKANEIDLKMIDFGWLTELQKYDFWNIEVNSPLAYLDKIDSTKSPIPNILPFLSWAKLRLVKGVQEKNVKLAIDETVHLGQLIHSTETLIGSMASIAILKLVVRFAKDQGVPLEIEPAALDTAKLYFTSFGLAVRDPLIDPQDFSLLQQAGFGPGYCAAMNESGWFILMTKPLLETELKDFYAKFDAILKSQTSCRWVHLRQAWSGDSKYVKHLKFLFMASVEARKGYTALVKDVLVKEDYEKLIKEVSNPRWPQYVGYLFQFMNRRESMFAELDKK